MKRKNVINWECCGICGEDKCIYKSICVACFPGRDMKFEEGTKMKLTMEVEDERGKVRTQNVK
jgi:hypothetical protein